MSCIIDKIHSKQDNVTSYDILAYLFHSIKPKSYLEIGTREGGSVAAALCYNSPDARAYFWKTTIAGDSFATSHYKHINTKYHCSTKNVDIYLCDTWGNQFGGTGQGNESKVVQILNAIKYPINKVKFITGDSKVEIPKYKLEKNSIDIVYIDGDHTYEGAWADMYNCLHIFNHCMVIDDIYHPSHRYLKKCVASFSRKYNLQCSTYGNNNNGTAVLTRT